MSAGGAFGGNRGARPVPPEKGVFPLDHMHLCDEAKKEYISCLKTSGHKSERNLMAKQDMSELGFKMDDTSEVSKENVTS
ncbi:cytochrome c oxidase assembly protein COX19-like isoform X2 [Rutidosis leptorrhynchoides]|uniref:cytochrome c oxidase assembly protein COX19-like isoform X2 n=1 Tax=Rutidosis leptorrhynchoides TaxID=125765 RepID=UPI003A998EB3